MIHFSRLVLVLAIACTAVAETITSRHVTIEIDDGSFTERLQLEVLLEDPADLERWSTYPIFLDEHVELDDFAAEVRGTDGSREKIPRRKLKKQTSVGFGLYSSAYVQIIEFPKLQPGDTIRIDITRRFSPTYPAHWIPIADDADQQRLNISIRGAGSQLRWNLSGWQDKLEIEESAGGLSVSGGHLDALRPRAYEPDDTAWQPTLWLAWDEAGTWQGVGDWYAELMDQVSFDTLQVGTLAARLTSGLDGRRDRLEAIASHVKTMIRYEAVEIGVGGYVPSSSAEVITRGWGDCKDKANLLVDLLAAVDIDAHMVLIRSGRDARLDPAFPTTLGFNHAIVAVPANDLEVTEVDPVVDGFFIIDATMDRGPALWLNPYNQGITALVVGDSSSRLVEIPVMTSLETSELDVTGSVDAMGMFAGEAVLRLTGERALPWVRGLDSIDPSRLDQFIKETFQRLLAGAKLYDSACEEPATGIPAVVLRSKIRIPNFVTRSTPFDRFRPATAVSLPDTRALDNRVRPMVLEPGMIRTRWEIEFFESWCPVVPIESTVTNDAGGFSYRVRNGSDGTVKIDSTVTLDRWWFPIELADELRELSIAENRASRKTLRLQCEANPALPGD
jgi:Domain of Unknown Function with PDB structure (DUF3857)/Transglutaminase-like superfamily